MKRLIYDKLVSWKKNSSKPLIVTGARQVGKTYLIRAFCENEYSSFVEFNLFENERDRKFFDNLKNFDAFEKKFKMYIGRDFDFENEIIFIDEIQESENAIFRLKQFNEAKKYNIICAGSLLGIALKRMKKPFPVGQVERLILKPFSFFEFLLACKEDYIIEHIEECFHSNKEIDEVIHEKCIEYFQDYLYIGGMPECVLNYINSNDITEFDDTILKNILDDYLSDTSKYTNSFEESKVMKIFNNIPSQLRKQNKKFMMTKIGLRNNLATTAKEWLLHSGIVNIVYNVEKPSLPLKFYKIENNYKLYVFDTGIFNSMSGVNKYNFYNIESDYRGLLAETYAYTVLYEMESFYYSPNTKMEIDSIIEVKGQLYPVEIKYGKNLKSRSLVSFFNKYDVKKAYRFSLSNIRVNEKNGFCLIDYPLYAIELLK